MFRNVLVGVDGRTGGHDAVALAPHLMDADGRLTFVHVYSGGLNPSHAITPGRLERDSRRLCAAA